MHDVIGSEEALSRNARRAAAFEGQSQIDIQSDVVDDSHSHQNVTATSNRINGPLPRIYQFPREQGRQRDALMLWQHRLDIRQLRIPLVLQLLWHWANAPSR